jgi:energy-coupling factor transport system permease protein
MENKDTFSSYHPIINFLFFALVIGCTMVINHPVCLAISLVCSMAYAIYLNGKKAIRFNLAFMLPMLILTALLNPAFSHQGVTILVYLPSGNPLTLESICYGLFAGFLLIAVISWFSCFNSTITSDKFIYLFGRIIPALSMILSMSLRFVPRFKVQIKVISNAQRCVGRDISNGSLIKRAKHGIKILSVLITWALENAIDTADSMKARGYGLRGRSAFSIYYFDGRDKKALCALLLFGAVIIAGIILQQLKFTYYPVLGGTGLSMFQVGLFMVYLALCALPLFLNIREDWKWRIMRQRSLSKV